MSYWNRPIIVLNGRWWRNYDHSRGIPWHARSTTIIRKSQLSSSHIRGLALKGGEVGGLSKKSLVFRGKAPSERLSMANIRVIDAKGKSVLYKKDSFVSMAKYKQIDRNNEGIAKTAIDKGAVYKYSGSKVGKEQLSKYSQADGNRSTSIKSSAFKYKSNITSKTPEYPGSTGNTGSSGSMASPYRYKPYKSNPESGSSGYKSGDSAAGSGMKTYKPRSSGDKSSIKSSGGKADSGSSKPAKKKHESAEPSYSSYGQDVDTGRSIDNSDSSSNSTGGYTPRSYKSYSSPSIKERRYTSSDSNSSARTSYRSSSSYSAPAQPNSSYRSSSSYSGPSSHSSYKSSSPSSHSSHSSGSSSSRSSSSGMSSMKSSSSGASHSSIKKKD